jgi:hypothetical protein
MPVQVYEDSLELTVDVLEENGYTKASWPYPMLKQTGQQERRSFRAVILENEYLKLTFLPELGGRLWELFDRRCQQDAFSENLILAPASPGLCGYQLPKGMLLSNHSNHPRVALANVDMQVESPESDLDEGSVFLGSYGQESFGCKYTLFPGKAVLRVEVSISNRSAVATSTGLDSVFVHTNSLNEQTHLEGICTDSIAFNFEEGTFASAHVGLAAEPLFLSRRSDAAELGPRQIDNFAFEMIPFFGVNVPTFAGPAGVGSFAPTGNEFKLCSSAPLLDHKIIVQSNTGDIFEAPLNVYPEAVYETDLLSIPGGASIVQIKSPGGDEVATIKKSWLKGAAHLDSVQDSLFPHVNPRILTDAQLLNLTSDFTLRVTAYLELAARATERGDYQRADTSYEHALLFNGDDPLAWWAKSVNRRIGNLDDENAERIELLNAHYLSPLEPCLRAEAFLAQPRNHGKDPSPLLASFNDVPENFIEVACQLIQARFYEEAAYFIDEALRHQNLGMLHYLHAYLLSRKGGMEMEVASRVQMATKAKFPPMPYRDLEREILTLISKGHELPQILRDWLNGDFD